MATTRNSIYVGGILFIWTILSWGTDCVLGDEDETLSIYETLDIAKLACIYLYTDTSMSDGGETVVDGKLLESPTPAEAAASITTVSAIRGLKLRPDARDEDLICLARLPELRYVNASYCYFLTDRGIAALEHHPKIRIVDLYRNEPTEHPRSLPEGFVLSQRPNLTEKSLRSLATIPQLRSLHIMENRFTMLAVQELFECKNLQRLSLRGNKLTPSELVEIRNSLPGCIVTH